MDEGSDPALTLTELPVGIDSQSLSPVQPDSGREQTAALAYRFWEERGRPVGSPEEDWFRAESEIGCGRAGTASSPKPGRPLDGPPGFSRNQPLPKQERVSEIRDQGPRHRQIS